MPDLKPPSYTELLSALSPPKAQEKDIAPHPSLQSGAENLRLDEEFKKIRGRAAVLSKSDQREPKTPKRVLQIPRKLLP
jgi:hypothetical protein